MATVAPLIGRRSELDALEAVLDGARAGHSRVLLIRGIAGIGKTALLDACVRSATGFRVLRADGVEGEAELAFAGLYQLLRPLVDRLDRVPAGQRAALEVAFGLRAGAAEDRFQVAAGTLALLAEAADDEPLLCVVDDLQWLDRPSAEALLFVARRLVAEPVALLLAERDDGPPLSRLPTLSLGALTREDARELVDRRLPAADRERILDAADGIPLALLELPRGPSGSMGALEHAFAERLAALPARTRWAVLLAAADDDPGGATALAAGLEVADLAPAEESGLLWLAGDRLTFRHPLVRSAAYGRAPFAERQAAHAALAGALSSPADADRRAWHRAAAATAPDAGVADELARSAERARARGGHAAAAAALERAARLTADQRLRAARLVQSADAARLAGDVDRALTLADEALQLDPDADMRVEATAIRGAIRALRGDPENAEDDLWSAARALLDRQPRRALRVAVLAGEAAALRGHHERALEIVRWIAAADAGHGPAERALAAFGEGLAHVFERRHDAAHGPLVTAVELAERAGDPQVLMWAGAAAVYAGDVVRSRDAFAHAVRDARSRGAVALVAHGLQWTANTELILGRLAIARTDATDGLALAQECGDEADVAHYKALLAWHAALRGSEEECRRLAAEAGAWSAAHSLRFAAESTARGLALLDLGLGRHEAAYDRLTALVDDPGANPVRRLLAVGDLVDTAVGCGRAEGARQALADLTAWGAATGSAWAAAVAAGADLQLTGSEAAYERAVAAHAAIDLPFERARLELRWGEVLRRARRRVDARRHLRMALDGFADTGAAQWERRAADELRATGETARRRDASTIDDLTPQELQIARLAADGATNRDIAGRLFLSPRTVEYHLRKVFQKLSVNTRTQLAGIDW